jgi:hypothetical protein
VGHGDCSACCRASGSWFYSCWRTDPITPAILPNHRQRRGQTQANHRRLVFVLTAGRTTCLRTGVTKEASAHGDVDHASRQWLAAARIWPRRRLSLVRPGRMERPHRFRTAALSDWRVKWGRPRRRRTGEHAWPRSEIPGLDALQNMFHAAEGCASVITFALVSGLR